MDCFSIRYLLHKNKDLFMFYLIIIYSIGNIILYIIK
jgi:hypothetical protein